MNNLLASYNSSSSSESSPMRPEEADERSSAAERDGKSSKRGQKAELECKSQSSVEPLITSPKRRRTELVPKKRLPTPPLSPLCSSNLDPAPVPATSALASSASTRRDCETDTKESHERRAPLMIPPQLLKRQPNISTEDFDAYGMCMTKVRSSK